MSSKQIVTHLTHSINGHFATILNETTSVHEANESQENRDLLRDGIGDERRRDEGSIDSEVILLALRGLSSTIESLIHEE